MSVKKLFYLLLTAVATLGCVEKVLIDVEPAEQKMVISSLFIPDSILVVTVSRSFSALSGKDLEALGDDLIGSLLVDQGLVMVSSQGKTDTLVKVSAGVYVGFVPDATPLDVYELYAFDSATQESVYSITQLKPQVRFDSVRVEVIDSTRSTIHYHFTDPEEQENFYLVQGFELPNLLDFVTFSIDDNGQVHLELKDPSQFFFSDTFEPVFTDLIADITQESSAISFERELTYVPNDTMVFVLFNIDQGYFDFLQARKRSGGILTSLTREPVNHPSNIENGYGYFTMHLPHFKGYVREDN